MFHKFSFKINFQDQFLYSLTISLLVSLALSSCLPVLLPDTSTETPPASSGGKQDSGDGDNKDETLTVEIVDLPERVCIGQPTDVTVSQRGFSGSKGDVKWIIKFGPVQTPQKTSLQQSYTFKGLVAPGGPVRTEPVRARVEILELTGDEDVPLADLTPEIGTYEKNTEFVYCNYNLGLAYGGKFTMGLFNIDEAGNMALPLTIDPSTGKISGSGKFYLTRTQGFSQAGELCNASWEGTIKVDVLGSLQGSGAGSKVELVLIFENVVIPDGKMKCEGRVPVAAPALGGPVNFQALGIDNLSISADGDKISKPVSQPLGKYGTGSGEVTIQLVPVTGK